MSITINLLPRRKTIKERVWKTVNIIVALATVLNVSGAAVWFQPPVANASHVVPPAPVWPTDPQWLNYQISGHDVTDFEDGVNGLNDDSNGGTNVTPTAVDIASGAPKSGVNPGTYPSFQYQTDANYLYVRMRLVGDPIAPGGSAPRYINYHWDVLVDKDNNGISDYVIDVFGNGSKTWSGHSFQDGTIGIYPNDPGAQTYDDDAPVWVAEASDATNDYTRTQTIVYGGVDNQYWMEFAAPISYMSGFNPATFKLFGSTSSSNTNPLQKDWMASEAFFLQLNKSKSVANLTDSGAITAADPVQPGDVLRYTLTVNNSGTITAPAFVVSDDLSDIVDYTANPINISNSGSYNTTTKVISWPAINLTAGMTINRTFDVTVKAYDQWPTGDFDLRNVYGDTIDLGLCSLVITKAVDKQTALTGETLTYTLEYENVGTANCTGGGVRIDDVIPANTTYVNGSQTQANQNNTDGQGIDFGYDHNVFGSANPNGFNGSLLSWDAETVVPGESGTVTYQVTVNQLPVCTTTNIDNTAKIYADQIPNGINSNQVRTVVTTPCNGNLTVNKNFDDNGDGQVDRVNPQGWTWDLVNGAQNNAGGSTLSLVAGNYSVTEDAIAGYTSTWSCNNQTNGAGTSIALSLAAEQNLTCTFLNTRNRGTLVVKKNVINPDDAEVADTHSFGITVSGQSNGTIAEGTDATYANLPTGTYTVTELPDGNYTFVSYSTDADANVAGAQVVITKGQTTTLTVTNKQKKVEIVVHKNVVAYDGQTDVVDAHSFTASVKGTNGSISESQTFSTLVNPGNVTVGEQADLDYVLVGITPNNFTVNSGGQTVHVTVTNKQKPSSVTGMKFNDVNGNGVKDQGDNDLADWTICLGVSTTAPNPTCTQTGLGGVYTFDNLMPGNYQVWEVNQAGWLQTYPANNVHNVTVGVNASITNKDFGNFQLGKISGYKWNDLNGNGVWDQGEPALSGWTVNLAGPINDSDVTDGNGFYEFTGLTVGQYSVTEVQQNGWIQTSVSPVAIDVVSSTNSQNNNFGNFGRGSISGQKFNDLNGNGAWDQGEPTIADWTIYLNDGQNIVSTQTNGNGFYTFSNLGPDDYTVSENLVTGWIQTFPPQNGTYLVTMTSGAQITGKDFGNFALGKISGYKWDDLNGNGAWDQGEPTISGWGMTLSNGQQQWNTLTDQSGYYEFNSLTAGTYSVTEETRAGWTAKTPTTISNIVVTSGVNSQNNNFGNFQLGSISGYKFNDLNGNGTWDQGEPTLSGWTIQLSGDAAAADITNDNGFYEFTGLDSGTYSVQEVQQAGWTQTTQNPADINVTSGTSSLNNNFGNFKNVTIQAFKFNDVNGNGQKDLGDEPIQGWGMTLNDGQGQDTDANGMASWIVTTGGNYTVTEENRPGWTHTTVPSVNVSVQSGEATKVVEFLNFQLGKISGYKYDAHENPLNDWEICLVPSNPSGVQSISIETVNNCVWTGSGKWADGYYEFTGLSAGTYTASETLQPGWTYVSPANGEHNGIEITSGANFNYDFVNRQIYPDLTVTKDDGATVRLPDNTFAYTIVVTNQGEYIANDVYVEDTMPAHMTFVSATVNGVDTPPTQNGQVLSWNLAALDVGEFHTIVVTVKLDSLFPNGTTPIENCVDVSVDAQESNNQNNRACDTDTVTANPILTLDKQGPSTITAGQNLTYTIGWTLGGTSLNATNVVISDPIPANTTFVSAVGGSFANGIVTWNLGTQNNPASGTVSVTVKVASPMVNGTTLTNTACVDSTQTEVLCDTTTTTVQSAPILSIVKSNNIAGFTNPGKTVTYTVTVSNSAAATDTARAVNLTDLLPTGFTFVDGGLGTKTFNLGDIAPGTSVTTTYVVNISAGQLAGTYTNTASAQGSNTGKVSATSNVEVRVPQILGSSTSPELTITKRVSPTVTNPGKIVSYTVVVKNSGDADATNVVVTDTLPKGFTFVDGGKATKTWALGTLEINHERVLNYQVKVGENVKAGKYENVATVTADGMAEEARATVQVKVPKVLGLATTGATTRDLALFVFGLSLIAIGGLWTNRQRRGYSVSI